VGSTRQSIIVPEQQHPKQLACPSLALGNADAMFTLLLAGEVRLSWQDAPIAAGYTRADVRAVAAVLRRDWDHVLAIADRLAGTA
jgi:hypothetical protein